MAETPRLKRPSKWGEGRGGRPWRRLRDSILARDLGLCQPCKKLGKVTPATEVDHIVNKAKGGTDDPSNLRAICSPCHLVKSRAEAGCGAPKVQVGLDGWPKA
jgi:5-methylcytosine-specific restriction protein A